MNGLRNLDKITAGLNICCSTRNIEAQKVTLSYYELVMQILFKCDERKVVSQFWKSHHPETPYLHDFSRNFMAQ